MGLKKRVFADLDRVGESRMRCSPPTPRLSMSTRSRGATSPAAGRGRHAFFQPGERHAPVGDRARRRDRARRARHRGDLGRRLGKVPVTVGVCYGFVGNRMLARRSVEAERLLLEGALPQEVEAAAGRVRLPDGAVRDGRSGRARCRLADPQGTRRAATRSRMRCARPGISARRPGEDISATRPARAPRSPTPRSKRIILDASARLGIDRRADRAGGDRRAHDLPDDQRGRAHSRRGDRHAPGRHRRDLGVWLWLADVARRADVLCRPFRSRSSSRPVDLLCRAIRRRDLAARPLISRLAAEGRGFAS